MQIILLCAVFIGIIFLSAVKDRETKPLYFTPPVFLKHFSLGYKDFWADILWLRFLQSADFCSFEKGRPVWTGDIKTCEFGWSYHITELITDLSPRFKTPYLFSAVMLSVFVGDTKGAELILQKGLRQFPKDHRLPFYSAYFYSFEMDQPKKASYYAYRSAKNGGPKWLYGFSNKQAKKAKYLQNVVYKKLSERKLTKAQKKYLQTHKSRARTAEARTAEARTAEARTAEARTAEARTAGARTAGARTAEARTTEARTNR